jgi:hypothetical protein
VCCNTLCGFIQGLELGTPVLERDIVFPSSDNKESDILPVSEVWLLSSSLPLLYTKPSQHPHSPSGLSNGFSSQAFLAKMVCLIRYDKPIKEMNAEYLLK